VPLHLLPEWYKRVRNMSN